MENKIYDTCVIGCGVSGMISAIYLGRAGKSVAIIDKEGYGGNISKSPKIGNIPGFLSISGPAFADNMFEQMQEQPSVEYFLNTVKVISYKERLIYVYCEDGFLVLCKSLIFATGTKPRELKLDTKNISYCVLCDGPFYKNKTVIVVGSGNTGATYALDLAEYCKKVYICDITPNMCCEQTLANEIAAKNNIEWLPETSILSVKEKDNKITSVILSDGTSLKLSGIFSAIGMIPQTDIVRGFMKLDERGYIDINSTVVPGVFAAGDCTNTKVKQVTTACAEGTIAATKVLEYLKTLR